MIKVNIMHYNYYYTHAVGCTEMACVPIPILHRPLSRHKLYFIRLAIHDDTLGWLAFWKMTTGMILVAKNLRVTYSMIYNSKNHFLFHLHTLTKAVGLIIILSRREERKGGEKNKTCCYTDSPLLLELDWRKREL